MPQTLGRSNSNLNLNLCFTKIKFPPLFSQSPTTPPPQIHDDNLSRPLPAKTAASSNNSPTVIRNFNSLYEENADDPTSTLSSSSSSSAAAAAAAFASHRFFCSTPGLSNSIVDSAGAPRRDGDDVTLVGNSVAVPTLSPDPYADFRRSMQEMLEASGGGGGGGGNGNWEFLNELLLCYLALNPKSTHKFIIGAFSDLVVSLLPDRTDGLCGISGG